MGAIKQQANNMTLTLRGLPFGPKWARFVSFFFAPTEKNAKTDDKARIQRKIAP